jgi:hypothetical protein
MIEDIKSEILNTKVFRLIEDKANIYLSDGNKDAKRTSFEKALINPKIKRFDFINE